jgi:asparagine N-glycosylation enzyme membrane subunit Stt3
MSLAHRTYNYDDSQTSKILTGWHQVYISGLTEEKPTKNGDATGFFIILQVKDGEGKIEKQVFMSFDHPSEFVTRKSNNIGAMTLMMFPDTAHHNEACFKKPFWLYFKTYKDKNTSETKESFFNSKDEVSLDGIETLSGRYVKGEIESSESTDGDDVPF